MKDDSGWWVWLGIFALIIWGKDLWNSKLCYELRYNLSEDKITILREPRDCDFTTAPLGSKGCHYDKVVSTVQWARSTTNNPIVSYDDGETWAPFTPDDPATNVPSHSTVVSMLVSWEKATD